MLGNNKWCIGNDRLFNLTARTGYSLIQCNGQRVYSAPSANSPPPKGCEVFVGKIPRDLFEDELVPLFERLGPIYQMRLMMDFNGLNRGFGFVSYYRPEIATQAVNLINGSTVRPGRTIGVYKSVDNCRLFVGGIPPEKTKCEIKEELSHYVDGISKIILYPSTGNKNLNRGFVFVEFMEHKLAAMARRKLSPGSLVMWGVPILVDWAEPLPIVDDSVMSKVQKLYVRNINADLTKEELCIHISRIVSIADVTRIHKILDYAFVHFSSRKAAENALKALQGKIICGNTIEVCWARPKVYSKKYANPQLQHFCTSLPPHCRKQIRINKESLGSSRSSSLSSKSPNLESNNNQIESTSTIIKRNHIFDNVDVLNGMAPPRMQQNASLRFEEPDLLLNMIRPSSGMQQITHIRPDRFHCAPMNMHAFQNYSLNLY